LVVYTPAVPQEHQELTYFQKNGFTVLKRAQVLGVITHHHKTVAVAGTHGKTTTSSLVAHILTQAGRNCTAFLGGITVNYQTNVLLGNPQHGEEIIVVEADEYDRSFLTLNPYISIITNIEADHLDIYGTEEAIKEAFYAFINQNQPDGTILLNHQVDIPLLNTSPFSRTIVRYGKNTENTFLTAKNIRVKDEKFYFDIASPMLNLEDIELQIVGEHNVENATAAAYVCYLLGVPTEQIRNGLTTFKGVKRRFEYVLRNEKIVFIDDYAHHPTEIEAFIKAVRAIFPQKKLTLIFQPHLYSRTRDFADDFARSLSLADEVLLLEIYPARELPLEGVSSHMLLDKINVSIKHVLRKSELLDYLSQHRLS
ncbi:MAG: UDP-N-acetylmuramate--L-alanine ligase, partial [Flammeovirgaceae bacterium]|nr:UDP-N-acetylmuramate--L-alanine ligase [Flammeovirgaceae bacterium]